MSMKVTPAEFMSRPEEWLAGFEEGYEEGRADGGCPGKGGAGCRETR